MSEVENTNEETNTVEDFAAVAEIMKILSSLSESSRNRALNTVATFFSFPMQSNNISQITQATQQVQSGTTSAVGHFSEERELSIKEFMLEKKPQTDVERVACLGYYLAHYREKPHFKTIDISKINTDAAQRKFSNPAKAVDNAAKQGYLVQAPTKAHKQLSAGGELFVQALPDRSEAKSSLIANSRPKSKKPASRKKAK